MRWEESTTADAGRGEGREGAEGKREEGRGEKEAEGQWGEEERETGEAAGSRRDCWKLPKGRALRGFGGRRVPLIFAFVSRGLPGGAGRALELLGLCRTCEDPSGCLLDAVLCSLQRCDQSLRHGTARLVSEAESSGLQGLQCESTWEGRNFAMGPGGESLMCFGCSLEVVDRRGRREQRRSNCLRGRGGGEGCTCSSGFM